MRHCEYKQSSGRWQCVFCGLQKPDGPPRARRCGTKPASPGLGDLVKSGLSAVGITEERVSRIIGRPCGCGKRAEALNRLGEKLGFSRKLA